MTALRTGLAVVAGFATVAVLSVAADAVMHTSGVFPPGPTVMSDALFTVAATYRALFTVLGGAVATTLAAGQGYRPAQILSGLGLLAGFAGVGVWFTSQTDLGPLWYALSIPVSAIPRTLAGAWLMLRAARRNAVDS